MTTIIPSRKSFKSSELALEYLDRHFYSRYIFPVRPASKFPPLVQDNLAGNASNDPNQIKRWAAKWPGCNWAVAHKKSKLLVVDVDCNEAKGKVGRTTFEALALAYEWPPTERTETPSGGFHLVYLGEHIMALGTNGIGKDIDSPNYTLIPGCVFKDGTSYVGNDAEAVAVPEWIYSVIKNSKSKARLGEAAGEVVIELDQQSNIEFAINFLKEDAEPAIEGQNGDYTTLKTALYLKDIGISSALAVDLLVEYYNPRCEPQWDRADLERKVENAINYGSLSKVGGKTAEADFADDVPEPIEPVGDPKKIAEQRAARAAAKAEGVKKPWDTQCAIIVNPPAFVDVRRRKLLNKASFNNRYGHIGGDEAHRKAVRSKIIKRYHGIGFRPIDVRSFKVNKQSFFNMYQPPEIEPMDGDPEIFHAHLAYLIPDEPSREHLINWLAWLVQRPDRKMMHAVLLLGNKRTGKSWFAELMKVILGAHNVNEPSKRRVASDFNGWLANRRLVIIHELREKGARGLYDELKEVITQPTVSINLKGIEAFEVESFAGILTISNHDDAIPIDDQEGRYLVIRCAEAPNFGKGTPASAAYYKRLFDCVGTSDAPGDEARKVLRYLLDRNLDNWDGTGSAYNGQGTAPETQAKADMVEAARSSVEKCVRDMADVKDWPLCGPVFSAQDVLAELPFDIEKVNRTLGKVEAALREIGARPLSEFGPLPTKGGRRRLWAIDATTATKMVATKTRREVATIYDALKIARVRSEDEADATEAADEFADLM